MSAPSGYWPYRTKPRDDELYSSWLVRQAWGLATRLQTFCVNHLGTPPGYLARDIDRLPNDQALTRLCKGTVVSRQRAKHTSLAAYEGVLWARFNPTGPLAWVMPIGRRGRRRVGHGLQYCRRCLVDDETPYFRRRWRLAFNAVCSHHSVYLYDACAHCGAPVQFHTGDFYRRLLPLTSPLTRCGVCQVDFREAIPQGDIPAPESLVEFSLKLDHILYHGWSTELPGAQCYSTLFFEGFRCLVRSIASQGRGHRLMEMALLDSGSLPLTLGRHYVGLTFEEMRLGDRAMLLGIASSLLDDRPTTFIDTSQRARVSASYLLHYNKSRVPEPWWYADVIKRNLFDRSYN